MKPQYSKLQAWLIILTVLVAPVILTAAVTSLDLSDSAHIRGILAKANGGAGADMSSVTFPSSGTISTGSTAIAASQMPNPSGTTLGGTESKDCTGSGHLVKIDTSGVPTCAADGGANLNQAAPTGLINGSNTSYTLSPTPTQASDVSCFVNGLQMQQGAGNDYTISSATITWLAALPTGAKLNCLWY
jgi:hypothetical protein